MFVPISIWEAKYLLSSLPVSFMFLLKRFWFWIRKQESFKTFLVISRLKPRNHSSQSMCPPLTGYLGCLSLMWKKQKKILLLHSFPPSVFHRGQSCVSLLPDRILLWENWCFVQKALPLFHICHLGKWITPMLNALSTVKTAKKSVQMHYQSHASVDFPNIV